MRLPKGETLSIRTSADIKQLLRMVAKREHRSITSMMEVLILAYAKQHGLIVVAQPAKESNKKKGNDGTH